MHDMEGSTRATTQTLDRRVERLEAGLAETQRTVDRLQLGQEHMRELMSARFSTVESGQAQTNAKLDALSAYLQGLVTEAQKQQIAWRDSPPAREILDTLEKQQEWRVQVEARLHKSERTLYAVTVICAIVVVLTNLIGPSVVKIVLGS